MMQLSDIVLSFTVCIFLYNGVLLWIRRIPGDRSRLFLSITFLASGLGFLFRLIMVGRGVPAAPQVLTLYSLAFGFLALLLLLLYPAEVISPGWLNLKRALKASSPYILLSLIVLVVPFDFRPLSSFQEIWRYAYEPNVWIRLLMLAVFVPYCLLLFYIPFNWKYSSATKAWIYKYTFIIQVVSILFFCSTLTGLPAVSISHHLWCLLACCYMTYQEFNVRLRVPRGPAGQEPAPGTGAAEPVQSALLLPDQPVPEEADPLWEKLDLLMNREELWRNPDLTLESLSSRLLTNRTTLSRVIRKNTSLGYKEFINRRRIEEVLKLIDSGELFYIQDAFFRVGFRSRSTALRYFREFTGVTPSEYINNLPH